MSIATAYAQKLFFQNFQVSKAWQEAQDISMLGQDGANNLQIILQPQRGLPLREPIRGDLRP
jgi:hypothetical protein